MQEYVTYFKLLGGDALLVKMHFLHKFGSKGVKKLFPPID